MTDTPAALEQRLLQGYQEQLRFYDQALVIGEGNDWAQILGAMLENVARLDAALAADKAAWRRSGQQAGKELTALVDQVAQRIATLADGINRHVADLQARKEKLLPEIDEFIRQRRMLEAYGQYGERPAHVA